MHNKKLIKKLALEWGWSETKSGGKLLGQKAKWPNGGGIVNGCEAALEKILPRRVSKEWIMEIQWSGIGSWYSVFGILAFVRFVSDSQNI